MKIEELTYTDTWQTKKVVFCFVLRTEENKLATNSLKTFLASIVEYIWHLKSKWRKVDVLIGWKHLDFKISANQSKFQMSYEFIWYQSIKSLILVLIDWLIVSLGIFSASWLYPASVGWPTANTGNPGICL